MKSCNLCRGKSYVYANFEDYKLLKCIGCGLLFTDQDSIIKKDLYSIDYFKSIHANFFADCGRDYKNCINKSKKLQNFLRVLNRIKKIKKNGILLDVGSATGVFLDMAKKNGFNVKGVDVSSYACKCAKNWFNLNVECGKLEDLNLKDNSFDIITMWDLIEHAPDPKQLLAEVNRLLKKDGIIFILTVNDNSLMGWLADFSYKLSFKRFKRFIKLIHPIHHNYHFKLKYINRYLEDGGFKIIWKEKSEMPLENIEQDKIIKFFARFLYLFSNILNLQHEIRLIARKK
ncbi:MAG TPA: class I SAM-dependent methyltransferase [Candidatus Nanoarchaeia archaeon]|nr:class I SAM-dependent methyltransferase [Candidatus Nanoarchaeia archaeon]